MLVFEIVLYSLLVSSTLFTTGLIGIYYYTENKFRKEVRKLEKKEAELKIAVQKKFLKRIDEETK